jgi:molecular chaperone IbpA
MTFITTPFMRSFVGFDQLFNELENTSHVKDSSYPAYNIEKIGDEKYIISMAVSGFSESDISIELLNGFLTIEGKIKDKQQVGNFLHRGIATRAFSKKFRIAETVEVTEATLKDGLLSISLHREIPEAEIPKHIPINGSQKIISKKAS